MREYRYFICNVGRTLFLSGQAEFSKHPFGATRFFSEAAAEEEKEKIQNLVSEKLIVIKVEI